MGGRETQNQGPADVADRARRAVRAVDLTEEEIAAIEASEMTPGFEYLSAELEPGSSVLVEESTRFARELGKHGKKSEARRADKAFRDSLYDDN